MTCSLADSIEQLYGDVYVMRKDGSDARMLTDNQFEEGTPAWVPERGRKVTCALELRQP